MATDKPIGERRQTMEEDFFDVSEEGTEENDVSTENVETEVTTETKQTSEEEVKTEENPDDKFIEYLNNQGITYNGENVKVNSKEELIATIQKGLNYDKIKAKADSYKESDEIIEYFNEKAKANNMTVKEYMANVKDYEAKKEAQELENEYNDLIAQGVPEETAKRVIEAEKKTKGLNKLENELSEKETQIKAVEDRNKEFEEFIKEYPELEASKIPQEVFKDSRENGKTLLNAYRDYENKQLKEKIKILEQNSKNASSSVVTPTTEGSSINNTNDAFLMGFDI